jgi:hypothetical protein
MTALKQHPVGAVLAVSILLAGWVASVVIRTWQHVEVELVVEMMGAATAAGIVYAKMSGRGPGGDDGTAS